MKGFKYCRKIFGSSRIAEVCEKEAAPGQKLLPLDASDEEYMAWVAAHVSTELRYFFMSAYSKLTGIS